MSTNAAAIRKPDHGEVDLDEAKAFLEKLAPDGALTFQTFPEAKAAKGNGTLARIFHGTFEEHKDELVRLNQQGAGVFVMVNEGDGVIHEGQRSCRTNANVIRIRAFFVDLDGEPLEPVRAAPLQPHIIVESSPERWHAYWLVSDARCDRDEFARIQKGLIAKFNSDPNVHDLCRVMRLPGFFHRKEEPFMSHVVFPPKDIQ
jgi:hypothetical protein